MKQLANLAGVGNSSNNAENKSITKIDVCNLSHLLSLMVSKMAVALILFRVRVKTSAKHVNHPMI